MKLLDKLVPGCCAICVFCWFVHYQKSAKKSAQKAENKHEQRLAEIEAQKYLQPSLSNTSRKQKRCIILGNIQLILKLDTVKLKQKAKVLLNYFQKFLQPVPIFRSMKTIFDQLKKFDSYHCSEVRKIKNSGLFSRFFPFCSELIEQK